MPRRPLAVKQRLLLLSAPLLHAAAARESSEAQINNVHASGIVLGHQRSWLDVTQIPAVHAAGLRGEGQIVGLGDTGLDAATCAFKDSSKSVPYNHVDQGHRKVVAYHTLHGDFQDGPQGHGTHIAGSIAADPPGLLGYGRGLAPGAKLVVLDLEESGKPGIYQVPDAEIGLSYLEPLRRAGASIAASPWSFARHTRLEEALDDYLWRRPEFLAVFPSGNVAHSEVRQDVHAPCGAKNVLCVGASFNARASYLARPSFVNAALLVTCVTADFDVGNSSDDCVEKEVPVLPALFGPTAPRQAEACAAATESCLKYRAACPECAFPASSLLRVSDALVQEASPRDGCEPLLGFTPGFVCLLERGGCAFALKVHHCALAGGVGAVVVNGWGASDTVMVHSGGAGLQLNIPAVLLANQEAAGLLRPGRRVSFPAVSDRLSPERRAPYSSYQPLAGGRIKPEVVLPGDNIASTAAGEDCALRVMSGTSQSCGFAAGLATLLRDFLQSKASVELARMERPWSSSLRALVVAAAAPMDEDAPFQEGLGFGLPRLAALLPAPFGASAGLLLLQGHSGSLAPQRFCLAVQGRQSPGAVATQAVLAWTDPPSSSGKLVHDLDLLVACSEDGWLPRYGNGAPDRANTLEKVLLNITSGLCTVSVAAAGDFASQAFALALAGPWRLLPGCEGAELPSGCGERAAGPFCSETPQELPLTAAEPQALSLRPWQWSFLRAATCGRGSYELQVESDSAQWLALAAGLSFGPELWSSAALSRLQWREGNASFSVQRSAGRLVLGVELPDAGLPELAVALFSKGREGPLELKMAWRELSSGCGPSSPGQREQPAGIARKGMNASTVVLYAAAGLLALLAPLALCCLSLRFCLKWRRRAKLAPDELAPDAVCQTCAAVPSGVP